MRRFTAFCVVLFMATLSAVAENSDSLRLVTAVREVVALPKGAEGYTVVSTQRGKTTPRVCALVCNRAKTLSVNTLHPESIYKVVGRAQLNTALPFLRPEKV